MRSFAALLLPARVRLQQAARQSAAAAAAGLLALVACGFLLAALYMGLARLIGAPLAALATGLLLLLLAGLVFHLGRRRTRRPEPEAADLAGLAARATRERPFETLLLALIAGALAEQIGRDPRR